MPAQKEPECEKVFPRWFEEDSFKLERLEDVLAQDVLLWSALQHTLHAKDYGTDFGKCSTFQQVREDSLHPSLA